MLNTKNERQKIKNGFITMTALLIVTAISAAVVSSVIMLNLDFSRANFSLEQGEEARLLAESCGNESLDKIKKKNFVGTGGITNSYGNCSYTIQQLSGENRIVNIYSAISYNSINTVIRKIKITITQINPQPIASWQDIADF
jgi:hypothetical protein